jgi:prolyl 4-hydroxylase
MGVPQKFDATKMDLKDFLDEYNAAVEHLTAVAQNPELRVALPYCRNEHELCLQWAFQGWCEEDFHYMQTACCPVCASAEQVEWLLRCPIDPNDPVAWQPGDLDVFFQNLTTLTQYEPTVHSQPSKIPGDKHESAPWVVTLENVINEEEANTLIKWGEDYGWHDSMVAGDAREDGTSEAVYSEDRTSSLAWCHEECMEDPIVQGILERLSNITNLHSNHSDYLQLLRYEEGQKYLSHHDFHHYQVYSWSGPRIMTLYIYLADVEEGGGTKFTDLNITVTPKLGRALLWPNVLSDDPNKQEEWTYHEALPPIKGRKYGATLWWHQRNFKRADELDCAQ